MSEEIKITSNGIKKAIDNILDENERLQDRVYKLEDILKEVREDIEYCIPVLEQEEEMSTDERSRKETGELRELLKKRLEILDKEN